jgi:UDP-glucose 4-epimerase
LRESTICASVASFTPYATFSFTVKLLLEKGYGVVVVDNLVTGNRSDIVIIGSN